MKPENQENNSNSFYYILIPYLLLVIVHILLSLPMKVPLIWPDEFAYLFFGKYIAGMEHLQHIPKVELTGSFGYSVLFSPIFMLFSDPQKTYSSILILNAIIGSSLYIGLFKLLKNLFDANNNRAFWISFIVSLYPAYMLQTDVVLTDAVTPACFVFGIVLFNTFIRKKTLGYGILFALAAGYLNWIHIRMLPFTVISLFFLVALVYYKRLPLASTGLSILIMIIMVLLGVILGDHLTYAISGNIEKSQRISQSLIQVAEVIFIFMLLGSSLYLFLKKYYLWMTYTVTGLVVGVIASTDSNFLWIIPTAALIYLFIIISSKKITFGYGFRAYSIFLFIAAFTYFVLPDFGYYTVVTERIMIWFINASGSMFYALFSTYNLFLMGLIFIIIQLWSNASILVPAVSHTDIFKEEKKSQFSFFKLLNNEVSLTLLFLVASAFLMIFITILPGKLQLSHYRADHLFYGRYVEVVIACFMAIAIYKLITSEAQEFLIATLSSWGFFILLSFIMIVTYDNIIPSELSFRSVLSFFPLRAVLGNINIMLYFLASIIVSVLVAFGFRYSPKFGKIILAIAFTSFTAFTYIYVDYYHQVEKVQRNKLIGFIDENFPQNDTISYDTKIFTETSQNGLSYVWLMNKRDFDFFNSSNRLSKSKLVISNSSYGLTSNKSAILLDIEHDGNDHLWLNSCDIQDSLRYSLMPSFYNIPLNKKYVGGVYRSGLYEDKWINGKAEISTNLNEPDSLFNIELELASSNNKPQNLIIWIDNKEIFNQNINQGGWRYQLNVKSDSILKKLEFKFFSDLTKEKANKNRLKGIIINSFIVRKNVADKSINSNVNAKIASYNSPEDFEYSIYPRRNIDLSQLNLIPGDTVTLPFVIRNRGTKKIEFDESNPVNISYQWKDFVFKSVKNKEIIKENLKGMIMPGEEKEIFITLKAPAEDAKFFLSFNLLSNKHVIIKPRDKREYLYNLKYKI
jgi:hypothetical protein